MRLRWFLSLVVLAALGAVAWWLVPEDDGAGIPTLVTYSKPTGGDTRPPAALDGTAVTLPAGADAPVLDDSTQGAGTPGALVAEAAAGDWPAGLRLLLVRGEPASGEDVVLRLGGGRAWRDVGDPLPATAQTDSLLTWDSLAPGPWRLSAAPDSTHVPTARSAGPLAVEPGGSTTVRVTLESAGRLAVRVQLVVDTPVPEAEVRVVGPLPPDVGLRVDWNDLPSTSVRRAHTDADGRFDVTGLALGAAYGVHAWTAEGVHASAVLVATSGDQPTQTITAVAALQLEVFVRSRDSGRPLQDAVVQVTHHGHSRRLGVDLAEIPNRPLRSAAPTDDEGRTTIPSEPGAWLLAIHDDHHLGTVRVPEHGAGTVRVDVLLDRADGDLAYVVTPWGTPVAGARVEGTLSGTRGNTRVERSVGVLTSDGQGAIALDELDELSDVEVGSLRLAGSHEAAGVGGLELNLGMLRSGARGLAPVLVLRPSGSLQFDVDPHGWPEPSLAPYNPRAGATDRAEQDAKEQLLTLTLCYLGTSALRTEFSAQHRARRVLDLNGFTGGGADARFDELEPGFYCAEILSRARGVASVTPSIEVRSGETTVHRVQAPGPMTHGSVTIDFGPEVAARSEGSVVLAPEAGFPGHAATPGVLAPRVAASARRAALDAGGRAHFDGVPPGRWVVGVGLRDADDRVRWHQAPPFDIGPGDELLLDGPPAAAPIPSGMVLLW